MKAKVAELAGTLAGSPLTRATLLAAEPQSPGLNDGLIVPGSYFPLGTSLDRVRTAALDRAPLRGTLRVIVVLVDFEDKPMTATAQHFEELFFSTGVLPNGSVKEYFQEVAHGLVEIAGEVVGPYRLPLTMAEYANGESGTGNAAPNARTMARHAAEAADPDVEFGPYDNDSNGFVDAFIVVHAGPGGEVTGSGGDIWSHKWVLSGGEYPADSTKIYAYLTVPEDARIGVCAHELGHLLFGWPDLYDVDGSSEGIGNWCLMAGGSWNAEGDVPAHPSAWCKVNQGWVSIVNQTTNGTVNVADVKDGHTVYRLWKDGAPGNEFFLLENRQRTRYDAQLPGEGLLIWHIDEAISTNADERHYKVALMQADGKQDLETAANRGDAGDAFPGSTSNTAFTHTSTPSSKSYGGLNTCVSVTSIGPAGPVMPVNVAVKCKVKEVKERKDVKEARKEAQKEFKEPKEAVEKPGIDKRPEKPVIDKGIQYDKGFQFEKPPVEKPPVEKPVEGGFGMAGAAAGAGAAAAAAGVPHLLWELEARVAALEAALAGTQPFIGGEHRPDLTHSALAYEEEGQLGQLGQQMSAGDAVAKRLYDTKPPEG
jgi:immune inhibitor A